VTLDELVPKLFPAGHDIARGPHGTISGKAQIAEGQPVAVLGVIEQTPVGIDNAILLSTQVLDLIGKGEKIPLIMLVDSSSQNMARRDEMLGLNEYLSHLYKCLFLAVKQGHLTVGILYGKAAAGAFIATCLSMQVLVAVDGAEPSVMDLTSIASVTKLPLDKLEEMAKSTPVFAPGIDHLAVTGAITETWDESKPLADRLTDLLRTKPGLPDRRDQIGVERKGRLMAASVAERIAQEAQANG